MYVVKPCAYYFNFFRVSLEKQISKNLYKIINIQTKHIDNNRFEKYTNLEAIKINIGYKKLNVKSFLKLSILNY